MLINDLRKEGSSGKGRGPRIVVLPSEAGLAHCGWGWEWADSAASYFLNHVLLGEPSQDLRIILWTPSTRPKDSHGHKNKMMVRKVMGLVFSTKNLKEWWVMLCGPKLQLSLMVPMPLPSEIILQGGRRQTMKGFSYQKQGIWIISGLIKLPTLRSHFLQYFWGNHGRYLRCWWLRAQKIPLILVLQEFPAIHTFK